MACVGDTLTPLVLVAFVAISLIVSCIMIGIITHISVMERTKEIGILSALGASKRNISQVFNAETLSLAAVQNIPVSVCNCWRLYQSTQLSKS